MSSEYKIGDRVKVTIEGEVYEVATEGGFRLRNAKGTKFRFLDRNDKGVTIERVVETFKAGDRVRSKITPHLEYTIGADGYISHSFGRWYTGNPANGYFTSDNYELVYRSPEADDE